MLDADGRKVDAFGAGRQCHAVFFSDFRQFPTEFGQESVVFFVGFHVLPGLIKLFGVDVKEGDDAGVRTAFQRFRYLTESPEVVFRGIPLVKEDGVIPPYHPFLAQLPGQFPEGREDFPFLIRDPGLYILSVAGDGKLEIIHVVP